MSEVLWEPGSSTSTTTTSTKPVQVATVSSATGPAENQVEEEFVIEQILDKRMTNNGQIHYLVKWRDFPHEENTWEHEDSLSDCPELLEEFHRRHPNLRNLSRQINQAINPSAIEIEAHPMNANTGPRDVYGMIGTPMQTNGFARGFRAQRILGAKDVGGELCYLINWIGSTSVDVVPAREANVRCPQVVINFYEDRIKWFHRLGRGPSCLSWQRPPVTAREEASGSEESG